jgi:hypothetical protein
MAADFGTTRLTNKASRGFRGSRSPPITLRLPRFFFLFENCALLGSKGTHSFNDSFYRVYHGPLSGLIKRQSSTEMFRVAQIGFRIWQSHTSTASGVLVALASSEDFHDKRIRMTRSLI